ncbi:MAG: UDP-N-acetylglucosamine-1-phosphate transferase [Methanomicrobiaceae archaeon]|nr:UDP-N-acetylglucosamine-1-phosphate transferase [Methanomicrobiaceae archaeon]
MVTIDMFVNSLNFMFLVFFIIPFSFIFLVMPYMIRKTRDKGHVVKDMYKRTYPEVPVNGGLMILLVAMFALSIISLFYNRYIEPVNYAIVMVATLFALFGILDDIIDIGRPAKLILLYYCSYTLIPFIGITTVNLLFIGIIDFDIIYLQVIVPTYVPVVANLVNMHSGFNGLAPGLSLIVLVTLVVKSLFFGNIFNILFIVSLTGALAAYWWFEKYPARIFWGNVGALTVGAAIGAVIVVEGYIVSGFIMLIPHTINFLLYVYWRLRTNRYPIAKFGREREDGTIEVPNPLTLKWVLPYYVRVTEQQATVVMYVLTAAFCAIGFVVPG